jgi:hypothetical protein
LTNSEAKERKMAKFNIGDRVRIKDRADWPKPPGYAFANAEGTVEHSDFDELMVNFEHLVFIKLEKLSEKADVYKGIGHWFLSDYVEKI